MIPARTTKPKLDLPTVRALMEDNQDFSQRGLILDLVERCEAAEAKLAEAERRREIDIARTAERPRVLGVEGTFYPSDVSPGSKCTRCGETLGRWVVLTTDGARHEICPQPRGGA